MRRIFALLTGLILLLSLPACASQTEKDGETFRKLNEAYLERGNDVSGFEVDEPSDGDGYSYFAVRVCLNTDDAVRLDDYVWFEAHLFRFDDEDSAKTAYENNLATGVGGTSERIGKFVLLYNEGDPFTDLYLEVFRNTLNNG